MLSSAGPLTHNALSGLLFYLTSQGLCANIDFLVLCLYGISMCVSVCVSVSVCFLCFSFGSCPSVCFVQFILFVLFYLALSNFITILWIPVCFPGRERKGVDGPGGTEGLGGVGRGETAIRIHCMEKKSLFSIEENQKGKKGCFQRKTDQMLEQNLFLRIGSETDHLETCFPVDCEPVGKNMCRHEPC